MAGTTAYDVKDALHATLLAHPDFAALANDDAIWYGDLTTGSEGRPREVIMIGEIEWYDEVGTGLGQLRRDEFYQILITIESHVPDDSQQEANHRVRDWMRKLEAIIKNPRWAGLPLVTSQLKPQVHAEGPDGDDGRGAVQVLALDVHARKLP